MAIAKESWTPLVMAAVAMFCIGFVPSTRAFQPLSPSIHCHSLQQSLRNNNIATRTHQHTSNTALFFSQNDKEYSRVIRLREEAESPFRKVRFFFYTAGAGSAMTGFLVSAARIAAALGGINEDLMQESLVNAGVDLVALVVIGVLWKRDVAAQESRLKRAAKGAELAKLAIRASPNLLGTVSDSSSGLTTLPLSSLRRGRGIEKRVVIAAAGKDKIQQVIKEAAALQDSLMFNDLVVVPVVIPRGIAPSDEDGLPDCVALPVGNDWKHVVEDEASEAKEQGVDVEKEGICIVLKKNGRVGQRTRGIYLENMVGEVVQRRDAGMDVSNI